MRKLIRSLMLGVAIAALVPTSGTVAVAQDQACLTATTRACVLELAYAATAEMMFPEDRVNVIRGIALNIAAAGDLASAIGAFDFARGLAEEVDPFWRRLVLGDLAAARAAAGDIAGAIIAAAEIEDPEGQAIALAEIASAQARAGDIAAAIATTATITDPSYEVQALAAIGRAQGLAGDLATAQETFERAVARVSVLTPSAAQFPGLLDIAAAAADVGLIEDAILPAALITDGEIRVAAFNRIFSARTDAAFFADARAVIDRIGGQQDKANALAGLGAAQLEAGDNAAAIATLRDAETAAMDIGHFMIRGLTHSRIATAQYALGEDDAAAANLDVAMGLADTLPDAVGGGELALVVSRVQIGAGDFEGAMRTYEQSPETGYANAIIALAAVGIAEAGDLDRARIVAAQAVTLNGDERGFVAIAAAEARAGNVASRPCYRGGDFRPGRPGAGLRSHRAGDLTPARAARRQHKGPSFAQPLDGSNFRRFLTARAQRHRATPSRGFLLRLGRSKNHHKRPLFRNPCWSRCASPV